MKTGVILGDKGTCSFIFREQGKYVKEKIVLENCRYKILEYTFRGQGR